MATHSSVLACRIPGTGDPGGLPSMGLHKVRHDWSDLAAAAAFLTKILKRKREEEFKKYTASGHKKPKKLLDRMR